MQLCNLERAHFSHAPKPPLIAVNPSPNDRTYNTWCHLHVMCSRIGCFSVRKQGCLYLPSRGRERGTKAVGFIPARTGWIYPRSWSLKRSGIECDHICTVHYNVPCEYNGLRIDVRIITINEKVVVNKNAVSESAVHSDLPKIISIRFDSRQKIDLWQLVLYSLAMIMLYSKRPYG